MLTTHCIVNNRIFLLGLDKLYRDAMKRHERFALLWCAQRVAQALDVVPAQVPVEGYYAEDERLTEYFLLMRALQTTTSPAPSAVESMPELRRLREVTSSALYGRPVSSDSLLPVGRDALSQALLDTDPDDWSLASLTAAAHTVALTTDEISLVGLAARTRDAVVLAATRESVVLYAEMRAGAMPEPQRRYVWEVDEELAERASDFVDMFNALFNEALPSPDADHAERYGKACERNEILGRCVRLGTDKPAPPQRHYHWGICQAPKEEFAVEEFWDSKLWTTQRYRKTRVLGLRRSDPGTRIS